MDYLFRRHVQIYVYCARRIPAHLRCTQCSIMLHLVDIFFILCICLWQILLIHTCLCVVVVVVRLSVHVHFSLGLSPRDS